ncbi:4469_t:CDS:2 [Ambispora gerdemannii]|uniref:4469_t:CDS:1 n=1 Tax=Ambispora gerdemannii TaxID=144530 RepID=A0A9N8W3U9_9GLOM|nr:4469_t:CDS:2 [Ambispora gerdemannii]
MKKQSTTNNNQPEKEEERFYKLNEGHIISACHFFDGSYTETSELCFDWNIDLVTAIGFTTSLLVKLLLLSSMHCDATYKTTRRHFELYEIISNVEGTEFPITYLTLNTTKAQDIEEQTGLQMKMLASFLHSLCDKGLQP